ncbi:ATPase [Erythrobacter litoralis]|uniref:ATPase n=1 Tax=Erythrobacter litoralis TaxID=39960 RepID=UPI002435D7AE|nr:ATPase [Erythrobacter litoralis]MDG6078644.1 ATPase [Erythrobacter litoralis]
MAQFALPLSDGLASGPAQIVLGEGNRAVADALGRPEDWPYRTAVLTGPPRSGKSLFLRWFAETPDGIVIDDAKSASEDEIFHLWNRAQGEGRPLLIAVGEGAWRIDLPDLGSRIGAALQLRIGPPDDAMAADLILSHAAQRGLALGDGAPAYLVPRIERSYASIEHVVAAIDRLSLERKAPATMSIWRDALDAVQGPEQGRLL